MSLLSNIISAVWLLLLRLVQAILSTVFSFVFSGVAGTVPPTKSSLLMDSAFTIAQRIRNQKVTCYEVVRTFIQRIEEVNDAVNAVVDIRFEEALEEAKKVDALIESGTKTKEELEAETPLLGVPFTTKDCIAVKGLLHSAGVYARKELRADLDADAVALLRKAGAIPLALTNVPEACMWYESSNQIHGRTSNPYDTHRTPGGSSGGEACLLAACGSPIGIGSDCGGSIRLPALFCGIFGHKPTTGVVPLGGHFPPTAKSINNIGPLCKYSSDLLPALKILSADSKTLLKLDEPVDITKLKYYYMDENGAAFANSVDPEIKKLFVKISDHFRKTHNITVERVNLTKLKYSNAIWTAKIKSEMEQSLSALLTNGKNSFNLWKEVIKAFFGQSKHTMASLFGVLMERSTEPVGTEEHKHLLELGKQLDKEFQVSLHS